MQPNVIPSEMSSGIVVNKFVVSDGYVSLFCTLPPGT